MTLTILGIILFSLIWILAFAGLADAVKPLSKRLRKAPEANPAPLRPYCLRPRP